MLNTVVKLKGSSYQYDNKPDDDANLLQIVKMKATGEVLQQDVTLCQDQEETKTSRNRSVR